MPNPADRDCLVTGASGFLGREVCRRFRPEYRVTGLGFRSAGEVTARVDLRDPEAVGRTIRERAPDVVIHCAAYREPDFCEEHPAEARRLNVLPVRSLCESLPAASTLALISTDYVFDGRCPPYSEDAKRNPVNVYGQTKMEAEDLVLRRPRSLVVRIPVLVGAGNELASSGFLGQMIQAVLARRPARVDNVLVRFPTWTRDVADALLFLLRREAEGVFHVSGPLGGTRYALTLEVARILGADAGHLSPSETILPRKAARPPNSALATEKIRAAGFAGFASFSSLVWHVCESVGIAPAG